MLMSCDEVRLCNALVSNFGGSGKPIRIICLMSSKLEEGFKKGFDRWVRPFFLSEDSTMFSNSSSSCHLERSTKFDSSVLLISEMFSPPSLNEFFNDIKAFDVLSAQFMERSGGGIGNIFLNSLSLMFFRVRAQARDFSVWVGALSESFWKK